MGIPDPNRRAFLDLQIVVLLCFHGANIVLQKRDAGEA
jgi:hypothetical protein